MNDNERIWRMFGGAQRAAKMTTKDFEDGLVAGVDDWEKMTAAGGQQCINRLARLGFSAELTRIPDGHEWTRIGPLGDENQVKVNWTNWSCQIEHHDSEGQASGWGHGNTSVEALKNALLDLDTRFSQGESLTERLAGHQKGQ